MEILDPSLQDSVNEKHLHQVTALILLAAPQSKRAPVSPEFGDHWRNHIVHKNQIYLNNFFISQSTSFLCDL